MKKVAQSFNTAALESNPGSRSRESEALHLSHCTLQSCIYNLNGLIVLDILDVRFE